MANREALRELQTRLASRLQAARSEGMSVSWLAVKAGGHNYLFPLAQAGEIVPLPSLQTVPYTMAWFRGVVNIRGGLFGVVDLAAFIAVTGGDSRTELSAVEPSVITFNAELEVNCALQVDALSGLRGADAFVSSSPAPANAPAYFGNYFVDAAHARWQEINLRVLSQTPEFLNISA